MRCWGARQRRTAARPARRGGRTPAAERARQAQQGQSQQRQPRPERAAACTPYSLPPATKPAPQRCAARDQNGAHLPSAASAAGAPGPRQASGFLRGEGSQHERFIDPESSPRPPARPITTAEGFWAISRPAARQRAPHRKGAKGRRTRIDCGQTGPGQPGAQRAARPRSAAAAARDARVSPEVPQRPPAPAARSAGLGLSNGGGSARKTCRVPAQRAARTRARVTAAARGGAAPPRVRQRRQPPGGNTAAGLKGGPCMQARGAAAPRRGPPTPPSV
jgi:hypothetical protein